MAEKIDLEKQTKGAFQTAAGKHGDCIVIGGIQICRGFDNVANGGTTLTFARPFATGTSPVVVATTQDPNEQNAWVQGKSNVAVTLKQKYTGG